METKGHKYFIEDGIVHVYVKPGPPSLDAIQESLDSLAEIKREHSSLFLLVDPRDATMLNSDQRKLTQSGFNDLVSGMAVLNNNLFVRQMIRLTIKIDTPPFPIKIFKDEELARKWLCSLREESLK